MQNIVDFLNSFNYGLLFIWLLRFGLLLTFIGFLITPKKNTSLKKIISTQQDGRMESKNPIVRKIEAMMEKGFLRHLRITDEKEYDKIQTSITAAGGLSNATPNTIQFFRIFLPIFLILALVPTYFLNLQVQNQKAINEATQSQKVEEIVMSNSLDSIEQMLEEEKAEEQKAMIAVETQKANPIVIMWLIILPLLAYFIPEYYLKFKARERVNIIKSEIPTFRTFALSMLETKTYPVYDILQILVGSTTYLKEDLIACTNEYFVDSKLAIKHLHDKIDDKEFHIVCNGLLQAIDEDKDTTLVFLHQQLLQYDTLARLKEQEKIKKKPNLFVVVLGMPLVSILVIWFYPWFLDAMSVLGGL